MRLPRPRVSSSDDLVQDDVLTVPSHSVRIPDDAGAVILQGRELFHAGNRCGLVDA